MADQEDFSKLPVADRWTHSNWKARKSAYDEVADQLSKGTLTSPPRPDELQAACSDANVIALESAIAVLNAVMSRLTFEDLETAVAIRRAVSAPLIEKGLVALKPAVKTAAAEALLMLVAVADPQGVVDDILPSLKSKSPKGVLASEQTLQAIFEEFGSPVADPKPVIQALPPLFAHMDRKIRAAAMDLAAALCRWVGEPVMVSQLSGIKPLQMTELQQKFAQIEKREPSRQTLQQKWQEQAKEEMRDETGNLNDEGVDNTGAAEPVDTPADPWDYANPQKVAVKGSFWEELSSAKWKERLEALTEVATMLEQTVRIEPTGDCARLFSELGRVAAKDANQMCATQAIVGLTALANGMRRDSERYAIEAVANVVERFREKRRPLLDGIVKCLDALYTSSMGGQITPILETVWTVGAGNKLPTVRLESTKYIAHLLSETRVAPKWSELEPVLQGCIKSLSDREEPMRQAAAGVIAVSIKLAGEQKVQPLLSSLDEHRRKRIDTALATATCRCKVASATKQAAARPTSLAARPAVARPPNAMRPGGVAATRPSAHAAKPGLRPGQANPASFSTTASTTGSGSGAASGTRLARPGQRPVSPSKMRQSPLAKTPRRVPPSLAPKMSPDSSMDVSMPSPTHEEHRRESQPMNSSTPKIVKRTYQRAEFTPARDRETLRRRMYSPAKMIVDEEVEGNGAGASEAGDALLSQKYAKLVAQFNVENRMRLELEKKLAQTQVASDRENARLREENATLRVQLQAQKEELKAWLQTSRAASSDEVSNRLSILSIGNDLASSRPPSHAAANLPSSAALPNAGAEPVQRPTFDPSPQPAVTPRVTSPHVGSPTPGSANAFPRSRVMPIAVHASDAPAEEDPRSSSNEDWKRAISITHRLKTRIENLKQMKERSF